MAAQTTDRDFEAELLMNSKAVRTAHKWQDCFVPCIPDPRFKRDVPVFTLPESSGRAGTAQKYLIVALQHIAACMSKDGGDAAIARGASARPRIDRMRDTLQYALGSTALQTRQVLSITAVEFCIRRDKMQGLCLLAYRL